MTSGSLVAKLEGSDRRSIGRVGEVVEEVLSNPRRFGEVFRGMLSPDPVLRMRCADAVEKITARRPELLQPFRATLLEKVAKIDQQEVQWHVAQLFSRLKLTAREKRDVIATLYRYLDSGSSIVKTFAMQALADIAEQDTGFRSEIVPRLETLTRTGTPAMKSRGRKLLAKLARSTSREV